MYDLREIQSRIEGMYAEPQSEEAQEVIHNDSTHVAEVWEDGEITVTKSGDLYSHRRIHQSEVPFLPAGQVLFTMDDLDDDFDLYNELKRRDKHKRMVITDPELKEILAEYREVTINQELIQLAEEHAEPE